MGEFDKKLEHWREQHRIAVEDLEALQGGITKIAEDTGEGWVDSTERWTTKLEIEVVIFGQLVDMYEKLKARSR